MTASRDDEYAQFLSARLSSLRRLAVLLCQDWQRADDLVQTTITKLYVHWGRIRSPDQADGYARTVLMREFLHERRSSWVRRVSLRGELADPPGAAVSPAATVDHDTALDLRAAVAAPPPCQRAVLVLRFYCDQNVDQSAEILGCSPGTVKSQTAKALATLRRAFGPGYQDEADADGQPAVRLGRRSFEEVPDHG